MIFRQGKQFYIKIQFIFRGLMICRRCFRHWNGSGQRISGRFLFLFPDLEKLREAVRHKEPVGFVGGPCLFGIDEMLIEFQRLDGHNEIFDCSCGRRCVAQAKIWGEESIEDYLAEHGDQVCSFSFFLNRKNGVTRQEYDSIRYLFAVAEIFARKGRDPFAGYVIF